VLIHDSVYYLETKEFKVHAVVGNPRDAPYLEVRLLLRKTYKQSQRLPHCHFADNYESLFFLLIFC